MLRTEGFPGGGVIDGVAVGIDHRLRQQRGDLRKRAAVFAGCGIERQPLGEEKAAHDHLAAEFGHVDGFLWGVPATRSAIFQQGHGYDVGARLAVGRDRQRRAHLVLRLAGRATACSRCSR